MRAKQRPQLLHDGVSGKTNSKWTRQAQANILQSKIAGFCHGSTRLRCAVVGKPKFVRTYSKLVVAFKALERIQTALHAQRNCTSAPEESRQFQPTAAATKLKPQYPSLNTKRTTWEVKNLSSMFQLVGCYCKLPPLERTSPPDLR